MFSSNIGIDLGTSTVLIYIKGEGIVLKEPSVVALNKKTNEVIAVGEKAKAMIGKAPNTIEVIRPLREGVISNYNVTEIMLKYFLKKVLGRVSRRPKISICVPSEVTSVERQAVKDATKDSGAYEVFVIEEPIAAAIGSGIDIARARGSIVVDIGGGTTDIAVISLGSSVVKATIKVAGDNFDEAIIRYIRKKHNVLIGNKTAEEIKKNIGTAYKKSTVISTEIRGKNLIKGLPVIINITSDEIYEALKEPVAKIIETLKKVLEKTPPELVSDIYERGIVMTGGGSLLHGLDKVIEDATDVETIITENALTCVVIGTGKYIEYNKHIEGSKTSIFYRMKKMFKWR